MLVQNIDAQKISITRNDIDAALAEFLKKQGVKTVRPIAHTDIEYNIEESNVDNGIAVLIGATINISTAKDA